jgi:carboxylesterase type B
MSHLVCSSQVPKDKVTPLLDVVVFIHGGAFMYGWSHEYMPHTLLDRDVVFVTFNYRLGPLGKCRIKIH